MVSDSSLQVQVPKASLLSPRRCRFASCAAGAYIERLGFFNPIAAEGEEGLRIDLSRVDRCIGRCPAQRSCA